MIDCVVSPVDQIFPVDEEDVKTTEPPVQNVVTPLVDIVGTAGVGFTKIVTEFEIGEIQFPSSTTAVYVPEVVTVMDCVVAPVDQTLFIGEDETNTVEPPEQNVDKPVFVIDGEDGIGLTVTIVATEVID